MTTLPEMIVALLAAGGLLCLIWFLFRRLLFPTGNIGAPVCIVVWGEGEGVGLEHTVNTLLWFRGKETARCPLLLVDAGLNEEGRTVARLLLNRWPELSVCRPEEIVNYIT